MHERKENVLFNEALNTFYLGLYCVGHMLKYHSDSERGNPLPPHGLLFPISSKLFFNMHHHTDRIIHTTVFVTPVVEHWLEQDVHDGAHNHHVTDADVTVELNCAECSYTCWLRSVCILKLRFFKTRIIHKTYTITWFVIIARNVNISAMNNA